MIISVVIVLYKFGKHHIISTQKLPQVFISKIRSESNMRLYMSVFICRINCFSRNGHPILHYFFLESTHYDNKTVWKLAALVEEKNARKLAASLHDNARKLAASLHDNARKLATLVDDNARFLAALVDENTQILAIPVAEKCTKVTAFIQEKCKNNHRNISV